MRASNTEPIHKRFQLATLYNINIITWKYAV
jgi:hypothetical protein